MKRSGIAILAILAVMAAPAAFAEKAKPLNAGKDGFKSNAGAGNGGEMVLSDTTVVLGESYTANPVTTTENAVTTTVPMDSVTKTPTATTTEQRRLANGRIQTRTVTTYEVVTVTGGITTTTYEEVVTVDVYTPQTQVETFTDVDPGRSGDRNNAPEISEETVETELDPVYEGRVEQSRTEKSETENNTQTTSTTETETGGWGAAVEP